MKARFVPPRENCSGNLLWNKSIFNDSKSKIEISLGKLREIGYWASAFPEGDGVTFNVTDETSTKSNDEMFDDFLSAFDWVDIEKVAKPDRNGSF